MDAAITQALIGLAGTCLGGLIVFYANRKKNAAEAANSISEAWERLNGPLVERVEKLEKKIDRYAKRVVYLMGGIESLVQQLVGLGQQPCWTPDKWEPDGDE